MMDAIVCNLTSEDAFEKDNYDTVTDSTKCWFKIRNQIQKIVFGILRFKIILKSKQQWDTAIGASTVR